MYLSSSPDVAMVSDRVVNELSAVVSELGGHLALKRDVHSDDDMSAAIREGFPHSTVEGLLKSSGFSLQEIASTLDLSLQTCNAVRARDDWRATSRIASTGWRGWYPLRAIPRRSPACPGLAHAARTRCWVG